MKPTIILILAIFIILIGTTILFAQPGLPVAPSQTPIDGGLGLLAAAGGGYALKKLRDRKKAEEELDL